MRVDGNMTGAPNYYPNSFSGPRPGNPSHAALHVESVSGEVARFPTGEDDNFTQVGTSRSPCGATVLLLCRW